MKTQKLLALLMALALVISSAVIATAENTDITTEDTLVADDGTAAAEPDYTLDEMLNLAMTDAYARQAAYAAYAEAFPDSRSITNLSVDSQIILLEMLLKAHDMTLPDTTADVTVPETKGEAYLAIAQAESNTVTTLKTYLAQEALTEDAQMIFRMVINDSSSTATTFAGKARTALRTQEWTQLLNSDNVKKYVYEGTGPHGRGSWTLYVVTNTATDETADEATTDVTEDTADTATEEGTGN